MSTLTGEDAAAMKRPRLSIPISSHDANLAISRFGRAPRSTAVEVLGADATDEEWLAARSKAIGASEIASVLDYPDAYVSQYALWAYKSYPSLARQDNFAMRAGRDMEPLIGEWVAEAMPEVLLARPGGRLYRHHALEWMVATPDFLAVTSGATVEPVEIKTDEGGAWGKSGTDQVPKRHKAQVWQQCAVFGAERGHVWRFRSKRLTHYPIPFGEEQAAEVAGWTQHAESFLAKVELGTAPVPDGADSTERVLRMLYPLTDAVGDGEEVVEYLDDAMAARVTQAYEEHRRAEAEWLAMRNQLREMMRGAAVALTSDGRQVARRLTYKRPGYEVAPTMVDQIRVTVSQ